ncbi:MAG: PAS domain S-box protein [Chloroflexi bacterium]|nr:PAS domain S-box protein [Chloroflexota bacterium]
MTAEHPDQELYSLIVEQAPDAVVLADRDGAIRLWNAAAEALFGYSAAEAIGQTLDILVPERFRQAHWAGFDRALASGETKYARQVLPARSANKGGDTIYVAMTLSVLRDEAKQVIGVLAILRDMREQRDRERALGQRVAELERQARTSPSPG